MSEVQLSKTSAKIIIGPTSNPNSQKLQYGFLRVSIRVRPTFHITEVARCASVYQRTLERRRVRFRKPAYA